MDDCLGYFRSSVGGFSVTLQYAVYHSERIPLSPVAFVRGAAIGDVFPFRLLSYFYLL
jgi:hypothetical protein